MQTRGTLPLALACIAAQACFFRPTGIEGVSDDASSVEASSTDESTVSPNCGDALCSLDEFQGGDPSCLEDCEQCLPPDRCYFEGDGVCDSDIGEAPANSGDCTVPICGDGVLDAGEMCDDGNFDNTDDCTNACKDPICGDGIVHLDNEECDDANQDDTDTCLHTCEKARCGDGYVSAGHEQCDDGNEVNADKCLVSCQAAVCGDGFVWTGMEECDENSTDLSGNCPDCKLPRCGDGFVWDKVEECDDGIADRQSCDDSCSLVHRRIFATEEKYNGDLDGIHGADNKCVTAALAAGLKNSILFKALLTDDSRPLSQRFDVNFQASTVSLTGPQSPPAVGAASWTARLNMRSILTKTAPQSRAPRSGAESTNMGSAQSTTAIAGHLSRHKESLAQHSPPPINGYT